MGIEHCMKKSNKEINHSHGFFHSNKESSLHHVISSSTKCAASDDSLLSILPSKSTPKSIRVRKSDNFKMSKNGSLYMIFLVISMIPAIISFILILSPMCTDGFIRRGANSGLVSTNKIISNSVFKSKQNYLQNTNEHRKEQIPFRILHIITSIDEYENGERQTKKGSNRLINLVIPTLRSTLESFTKK